MAGLGAAAWGVTLTRRTYAPERPSTFHQAKERLASCLRRLRRRPTGSLSGSLELLQADAVGTAEGAYVLKGPPLDGTAEQRERFLLEQVVDLQKWCIALHQEQTAERRQREMLISELADAVTAQERTSLAAIAQAKANGLRRLPLTVRQA